ncbi:hypothetical protein FRX31_023829 [Thalictrum thalictroides]|uniref:Uncharacterized protein n=1 Tax=Thalictrum thalictroides TaxID=46969 RepID=A0A7J6VQT4_THATH|nr:hypothetical protein FRX31_023829 [Thalictrum thalictroides]
MMQQLLGQFDSTLAERPKGSLASQLEPNPKGKGIYKASTSNKHVNAITTLCPGRKVRTRLNVFLNEIIQWEKK